MAAIPTARNQSNAGLCPPRTTPGKPAEVARGASLSLDEFNDLVLNYQDAAYTFACYLTGDPDLAEDVTQKAFINAYLNIKQFRGDSFRAWLFKIIRNVAYDEFRRPSYRKDTSLEALEDDHGWESLPVETEDPLSAVETHERIDLIQRAIDRIPEPYHTILLLVDVQEMDYQEAAQAAGVPVGTVKSRLARARRFFRAALNQLTPVL